MSEYVSLAKKAIEKYVNTREVLPVPSDLPQEFYEKNHGVFVSLHNGKELRGCIGTYQPCHKNMAEEMIMNAIAASSADSRFDPIRAAELPELTIEVSLLSEPEKVSDLSELDPQKYGVIVKCDGGKCGLLLPALEGINDVEQQISIACQKGAINSATDRDIEIRRFSVKKYSNQDE